MDHAWSGRPAPHRVAAPIEPQAGLVEGRAVAADAVLPENRLHVAREIHFVGRLRDRRLEGRKATRTVDAILRACASYLHGKAQDDR
jgi:hypothetical protein